MKRFQGLLLCTDLDGTLLSSDRTISKENLDAIEYFKAEGGAFTFITGRMPYFVTDLVAAVRPNAPVGCINGGGLYDFSKQSYLYTKELPRTSLELIRAVDEAIEGIGIQINTFDRIYFCRENAKSSISTTCTKANDTEASSPQHLKYAIKRIFLSRM